MRYRRLAFGARETALTALLLGSLLVSSMPRAAEHEPHTKPGVPASTPAPSDSVAAIPAGAKRGSGTSFIIVDVDPPVLIPIRKVLPSLDGPIGAWNEFVNALSAGDIARAMTFVSDTSVEKYGEVLQRIAPRVRTVSRSWSTPEPVSAGSDYMTFLVVDSDNQGGTGHLISMVLEDGRWVVDQL